MDSNQPAFEIEAQLNQEVSNEPPYNIIRTEPFVPTIQRSFYFMQDSSPMVPIRPLRYEPVRQTSHDIFHGEPNESNLFGYETSDFMRQRPFSYNELTSPGGIENYADTMPQNGVDLTANLNGSTIDEMRTLIQQQIRANARNAQDTLRAFLRMKPNSFSGTSNPDDAFWWLQQIRKNLDVMKCPEDDQVHLATYMLSGQADAWWNVHKSEYKNERPYQAIAWKWFEKAFLDHHFPDAHRRARKQQFRNLKQGEMSVQKYVEEWYRLFILGGNTMLDTDNRVALFVDGLRPHIGLIVKTRRPKHVSEAVEMAISVERKRHESRLLRKEKHGAKRTREVMVQDSSKKTRHQQPLCSLGRAKSNSTQKTCPTHSNANLTGPENVDKSTTQNLT